MMIMMMMIIIIVPKSGCVCAAYDKLLPPSQTQGGKKKGTKQASDNEADFFAESVVSLSPHGRVPYTWALLRGSPDRQTYICATFHLEKPR